MAFALPACGGDTPPASTPGTNTPPDGAQIPGADGGGQQPGPDGKPPPGVTDGGTPPGPGASGCKALAREVGVDYGGLKSDKYAWYDGDCKLRTAGLVQGNAPGGGGFARGFTYEIGAKTRKAFGTNSNGWNGFGYVVSHFGGSAALSKGLSPAYRAVLAGTHHAIHEFKMRISPGGPVDVTVQWFFATGRSNPIYAITYDSTPAGPDVANGDSRSPYGDLAFDETQGDIDGVGWGDKYQFTTNGNGPLTLNSAWDYTKPNTIPYDLLWANKSDAEMGLVQTQTFTQLPAGGDYGGGVLGSACWAKTSANQGAQCKQDNGLVPHDWLWPFQLNQYELPFTTVSHRLAWGASYGAVGKKQYTAFGATPSGYPYLSYSLYVVLGTHSAKPVFVQRTDLEVAHATRLTATRGTVATSGPGGVGRTDATTYGPAGFNHVFGTWDVVAAGNAVTAQLAIPAGALKNPIFRVREYGAAAPPTTVRVGGKALAANDGYFATVDAASKVLWVTLNQTITGTTTVEIE